MNAARGHDSQPLRHRRGSRRVLLELLLAMAGTSVLVCSLVGGAIHLYATVLAFQASGYVGALLTFSTPFFAELYWIAIVWSETGTFWHGLTVASLAYVVICIMAIVAGRVAACAPD